MVSSELQNQQIYGWGYSCMVRCIIWNRPLLATYAGNSAVELSGGGINISMNSAVLLIDDNAIQAATRQTILKRAGYFVIAALNAVRALQQLQNNELPIEVGLVITDHLMPEMNGADFVRELRKIRPQLPVLVISGLEEAAADYEGLNVVFRVKPLLPDHLLASVHSLMSQDA